MASVDIKEVWKMLTAILDTKIGQNLLKENCLPQAESGHVVTIKSTRVQAPANTQLKVKELMRLEL